MEADRDAILTVRAHLAGSLDCRRARLLDKRWWRRSAVIIDELGKQEERQALRVVYDLQRAVLASGLGDGQQTHRNCREACNSLLNSWFTWRQRTLAEVEQAATSALAADYKRLVGDTSDPQFMAKVMNDVRILQERSRQAAQAAAAAGPWR